MEMFPAKYAENEDASIYQCTSSGHRTHGRILKCLHCGLVFNETRHDAKKLLDFYSNVEDPTYLKNIDSRFKTFRYNFAKIKPRLPASGKLLDIGSYCGISLKVAHENGFETLGVEPSKWAAGYSEEVMQERVFQGVLRDLPTEEGPFDVITMWDVIEHLEDPIEHLQAAHRLLHRNGILVIETQNVRAPFARLLGRKWQHYKHEEHLYHFHPESLQRLLALAGFEVVENTPKRGGKYVSMAFLVERVGRIHPALSLLSYPLRLLGGFSPYLNSADEMVIVARKTGGAA